MRAADFRLDVNLVSILGRAGRPAVGPGSTQVGPGRPARARCRSLIDPVAQPGGQSRVDTGCCAVDRLSIRGQPPLNLDNPGMARGRPGVDPR